MDDVNFIAITTDGYIKGTEANVVDFLKGIVSAENDPLEEKTFEILCQSGKMELPDLINYANRYLLCSCDEIKEIYRVGEKIF